MPELTALTLASYYVEELKYGPGDGALEVVSNDQLVAQMEALLRDAGVTSMTGADVVEDLPHYARNWAASVRAIGRVTPGVLMSIFLDGFMHGVALARELEGPHPTLRTARTEPADA